MVAKRNVASGAVLELPSWRGVWAGLALFWVTTLFTKCASGAELVVSAETADFGTYLLRVGIGIGLLAFAGGMLVRFGRRKDVGKGHGVELLAVLPLGRDEVRILVCGPDVVALLSSRAGTVVLGRWRKEEWFSACASSPDR